MIYSTVVFLFTLLFLFPYIVLIKQFSVNFETPFKELIPILQNTFIQSLGSGFFSLVFGLMGGMGLIWLSRVLDEKKYVIFENLILIPNLLPSLFVILSCLSVIKPFPFGITGVIIIHTLINVGLVSVLFRKLCISKLGSLGELSLIEGARGWQFFKTGVLGYLRLDLFYIFLFVFSISLISFTAPFMVGGPTGATLEVLIYEKIAIHQNWAQAIGLSIIQMGVLGLVSLFTNSLNWNWEFNRENKVLELIEWKWGVLIPLSAFLVILYSPIHSLPNGIKQLSYLNFSLEDLLLPTLNSIKLSFFGGFMIGIFSLIACYGYDSKWFKLLSQYFISPGPILLGFSFFIIQPALNKSSILDLFNSTSFQITFGLSLLFFWTLYRLTLASNLKNLVHQIDVARVLGASPYIIFKRIVFPQMINPLVFVCSLGSMWVCGDFAFSKIVAQGDYHLALIVKNLTSSYRLDAAQALSFILYVISFCLYIFWWRIGNVINRKFSIQER